MNILWTQLGNRTFILNHCWNIYFVCTSKNSFVCMLGYQVEWKMGWIESESERGAIVFFIDAQPIAIIMQWRKQLKKKRENEYIYDRIDWQSGKRSQQTTHFLQFNFHISVWKSPLSKFKFKWEAVDSKIKVRFSKCRTEHWIYI